MFAIYMSICDVIKQNESELTNIDFQIEPIITFNFLCILLFFASLKWLYLWNRILNFDGGFQLDTALQNGHWENEN